MRVCFIVRQGPSPAPSSKFRERPFVSAYAGYLGRQIEEGLPSIRGSSGAHSFKVVLLHRVMEPMRHQQIPYVRSARRNNAQLLEHICRRSEARRVADYHPKGLTDKTMFKTIWLSGAAQATVHQMPIVISI